MHGSNRIIILKIVHHLMEAAFLSFKEVSLIMDGAMEILCFAIARVFHHRKLL
jgi:hypothetical protein